MYHPETEPPILIADQNGTVHAFSSQFLGELDGSTERAIIYNQWTAETGWTIPVDILLSPIKNDARLLDVFLDESGMFHLVFFGGDDIGASIYYSKAPAEHANLASAWSIPTIIGQKALTPENGAIAGDDEGNLISISSGSSFGRGWYTATSSDSGDTWSEPELVFPAYVKNATPTYLQTIVSDDGRLHAVWSVNDIANHGLAIYYATYDFATKEWNKPITLAEQHEVGALGTQAPAIVEHDEILHISYYNSVTGQQYFVKSMDNGLSWSKPIAPFPHVGLNGPGYFVIDSNNDLHYLWAQRITLPQGILQGMWHSTWQGTEWSEYEAVVTGKKVIDTVGFSAFDPNTPHVAISRGNEVLVTWRTDRGSRGNGVWYSVTVLDAPPLPVVALPTIPPASAVSEDVVVTNEIPEPAQKALPEPSEQQDFPAMTASDPIQKIPIALIPVTLLILPLLFWQFYKGRYR